VKCQWIGRTRPGRSRGDANAFNFSHVCRQRGLWRAFPRGNAGQRLSRWHQRFPRCGRERGSRCCLYAIVIAATRPCSAPSTDHVVAARWSRDSERYLYGIGLPRGTARFAISPRRPHRVRFPGRHSNASEGARARFGPIRSGAAIAFFKRSGPGSREKRVQVIQVWPDGSGPAHQTMSADLPSFAKPAVTVSSSFRCATSGHVAPLVKEIVAALRRRLGLRKSLLQSGSTTYRDGLSELMRIIRHLRPTPPCHLSGQSGTIAAAFAPPPAHRGDA